MQNEKWKKSKTGLLRALVTCGSRILAGKAIFSFFIFNFSFVACRSHFAPEKRVDEQNGRPSRIDAQHRICDKTPPDRTRAAGTWPF
jgi:hypothetical protein